MEDMPVLIELEILNYCNYKCTFCFNDKCKPNHLTIPQVKELVRLFKEINLFKLVITGGEPTIHPNFLEVLTLFKDIPYISLFTNGSKLGLMDNNPLIKEIILSVPDTNEEKYYAITQERLSKVKEQVTQYSDKNKITMHTVVTKENFTYLEKYVMFAQEYRIKNVSFAPVRISEKNSDAIANLVLEDTDYNLLISQIKDLQEKYSSIKISIATPVPECVLNDESYNCVVSGIEKCNPGVGWCVIDSFLNVRSCPHSQTIVGNLSQDSFNDIWERDFDCASRSLPNKCRSCEHLSTCGICKENVEIVFNNK